MTTPFFEDLAAKIAQYGGFHNAHLHLCRAGTLSTMEQLLSASPHAHLSISAKHGTIPLIHASSEYQPLVLEKRVRFFLDEMIKVGTRRADTLVDVTNDSVGRTALDVFVKLKADYSADLDLQVGCYSPLGFKDSDKQRWQLIEESVGCSDFIGGLPERDDKKLYPEHIGFEESCLRVISLGLAQNKQIHLHVDQKNDPEEKATERVLAVWDQLKIKAPAGEPILWLVHVISPSCYQDTEFDLLAKEIARRNIGVICCPSAAISMRLLRPLKTPTHNSIARVLEFLAQGVQVRLGSDNINDISSPAGTTNLMDEVFLLCNAVRFYDLTILAKIASGTPLELEEREKISEHLERDGIEIQKSIQFTRS